MKIGTMCPAFKENRLAPIAKENGIFHFISIQTAFSGHFSFQKHFFYISLAYDSLTPFSHNHLETIFFRKFFLPVNGKFTPFIFHSLEQMGRKCYFDNPLCSGLPFSTHFFSEPFLIEKMVSCILP